MAANSKAKGDKPQKKCRPHRWYTGSLGSRGDYDYPVMTICMICGKEKGK